MILVCVSQSHIVFKCGTVFYVLTTAELWISRNIGGKKIVVFVKPYLKFSH